MPKRHIVKIIKTQLNAKEVGEVILNVNGYKNFIPYCTQSEILETKEGSIIAKITIAFAFLKVEYTSEIFFSGDENHFTINVIELQTSKHKVFKDLKNTWKITKKGEMCEIDFFVDFEIKNVLMNKIAGKSLHMVSEIILQSFTKQLNNNTNFTFF